MDTLNDGHPFVDTPGSNELVVHNANTENIEIIGDGIAAFYGNFNAYMINDDEIEFDFFNKERRLIIVEVHRGQIMQELITKFMDLSLDSTRVVIVVLLPNGKKEAALDEGGVFRDALSEFWESFYDQCTKGTTYI